MDDGIRFYSGIEPLHCLHFNEVIVLTSWNKNILTSSFLEFPYYKRTEESSATSD
jgi:hypothetical protein